MSHTSVNTSKTFIWLTKWSPGLLRKCVQWKRYFQSLGWILPKTVKPLWMSWWATTRVESLLVLLVVKLTNRQYVCVGEKGRVIKASVLLLFSMPFNFRNCVSHNLVYGINYRMLTCRHIYSIYTHSTLSHSDGDGLWSPCKSPIAATTEFSNCRIQIQRSYQVKWEHKCFCPLIPYDLSDRSRDQIHLLLMVLEKCQSPCLFIALQGSCVVVNPLAFN